MLIEFYQCESDECPTRTSVRFPDAKSNWARVVMIWPANRQEGPQRLRRRGARHRRPRREQAQAGQSAPSGSSLHRYTRVSVYRYGSTRSAPPPSTKPLIARRFPLHPAMNEYFRACLLGLRFPPPPRSNSRGSYRNGDHGFFVPRMCPSVARWCFAFSFSQTARFRGWRRA